MKKLWALMAILLTFTLTTEMAHAKRFGGGKSFGRSYQTTPYTPNRAAAAPAANPAQKAAPAAGAKKGLMGGLLGGLLAGGLLAALFAGGAFDGIQLMDILMIAAAAFIAFKLFGLLRQRAGQGGPQPAYAGAGASPAAPAPAPVVGEAREALASAPGTGGSVPFNLPMGFDSPAFLAGAKTHFRTLQDAWNRNDLNVIREYVTPELFDELRVERATQPAEQQTEILRLDTELVRADQAFGLAEVSISFSGVSRETPTSPEESFLDVWHLQRDYGKTDAPWHITGIESR